MKNKLLDALKKIKRKALITSHDIALASKKSVLGVSHANVKLTIVGAQKCGTTSLFHYLSQHPDIDAPQSKEIDYFNSLGNTPATLSDYQTRFPYRFGRNKEFASIDVSPSYLLDAHLVAKRIHAINPNTKIVIALREPVSRAISAWFMYKKLYAQNPDWFIDSPWVKNNSCKNVVRRQSGFGHNFDADIAEEMTILGKGGRIEYPIVEFGLYKEQIETYTDLFGRDNVLIVSSARLKSATQDVLNQITSFIEIPSYDLKKSDLIPHFVGDNKYKITGPILSTLNQYYDQQNQGLTQILGEHFEWDTTVK